MKTQLNYSARLKGLLQLSVTQTIVLCLLPFSFAFVRQESSATLPFNQSLHTKLFCLQITQARNNVSSSSSIQRIELRDFENNCYFCNSLLFVSSICVFVDFGNNFRHIKNIGQINQDIGVLCVCWRNVEERRIRFGATDAEVLQLFEGIR